VFALLHCVGATPNTTWPALVRRLLLEFKDHFGLTLDAPEQPALLRAALVQGLAMVAARGKTLVVLDGLDQLEDQEPAGVLHWLPREVPPQVRLIVSTTPGPLLAELSRRRWPQLEVKPLRRGDCQRLVAAYLGHYGKRLNPLAAERIAGAAPSANPLYLRTLLEELRVLGRHEEVPVQIGHYLAASTAEELFAKVLARWELDYDRERPALVRDAMTFLWASRHGLTEGELLELLRAPGDPLPFAIWSPIYRASETLLVNRSGLLTFGHCAVHDAVGRAYCVEETSRQSARRRLADYFAGRPWSPRKFEELPWQLAGLRAWPELMALMAEPSFFTQAWATYPPEVKALWALLETAGPFRLVDAYLPILDAPEEYPEAAWALAALLGDTGHLAEALRLGTQLGEQARAAGDLTRLQDSLGMRAMTLTKRGDMPGALQLLLEQEQLCQQRGDRAALAMNLGNQGVLFRNLGERERAQAKYGAAEALCRLEQDWLGVAASLGNQGVLFLDRQDFRGALDLFQQQEGICRAHGDLAGLQVSLGNQAAIHRSQGQLARAQELHRQEEQLCRRLYDRAALQTCLGNQARICQEQEDYDGAVALLQEREAICRQDHYREGLARALFQQAELFGIQLSQVEYALPRAEEALRWAQAVSASQLAGEIEALLERLRASTR
jgi:tetratricopeptide (TPR) repeat protein